MLTVIMRAYKYEEIILIRFARNYVLTIHLQICMDIRVNLETVMQQLW